MKRSRRFQSDASKRTQRARVRTMYTQYLRPVQLVRRFLGIALLIAAAVAAKPAYADEMDDFIGTMTQKCQELTQKRDELAREAAQKGGSPPAELSQSLSRLN